MSADQIVGMNLKYFHYCCGFHHRYSGGNQIKTVNVKGEGSFFHLLRYNEKLNHEEYANSSWSLVIALATMHKLTERQDKCKCMDSTKYNLIPYCLIHLWPDGIGIWRNMNRVEYSSQRVCAVKPVEKKQLYMQIQPYHCRK
jgi:hypothetical protein